jgi:hypothetical protein
MARARTDEVFTLHLYASIHSEVGATYGEDVGSPSQPRR